MPVAPQHEDGFPFYLAWVTADETTFGAEHHRYDEYVITAVREWTEGDIPKLALTIKNPYVGLLADGRKTWCWWAWHNGIEVVPLFFGQLVGIPTDLLDEVITLVFIAKPLDYEDQKQALAETLKIPPQYDMVFLDESHRDDPDAVLEAYSGKLCVDPVTHELTLSDIIVAEDGEEVFTRSQVPYNSVAIALNEKPLRAVVMDATVPWTQRATGGIDMESPAFASYTGDAIISGWLKPLASLGSGWSVAAAFASDVYEVEKGFSASYSFNWQNKAKKHNNGDTMSVSLSASDPYITGPRLEAIITEKAQVGIFDPYADPQVNVPASYQNTSIHVPQYLVATFLNLKYEAARPRSERIRFVLTTDLQDILARATESEAGPDESEIITLQGADVGLPLIDVKKWLSVKGKPVALGTIVTDGVSFQIAIIPGIAGNEEPEFSDSVGETTIDGTVTWASLGTTLFPADVPDWVASDDTPLGQVIFPKPPRNINWDTLVLPAPTPTEGVPVTEGLIVKRRNGASYQVVTEGGTTLAEEPDFSDTRGVMTFQNGVTWTSLGPTLPGASAYFVCTGPGITGALGPHFNVGVGEITVDNGVEWTSLGLGGFFVGVPIGDVSRSSYFPIDRGVRSLEYLICVARAHLLAKSRAVSVSWDCKFDRAVSLTCRKMASLSDHRLPGGMARGKIVACTLNADGPSGKLIGNVKIACAIGRGNSVEETPGTPVYVEEGVLAPGIQAYEGQIRIIPDVGDVGYSRPIHAVIDDGLVFPLDKGQVVISEGLAMGPGKDEILAAFRVEKELANIGPAGSPQQAIENHRKLLELNKRNLASVFQNNPTFYEFKLKPVTNGPFNGEYDIELTDLVVPKMIDLEAEAESA